MIGDVEGRNVLMVDDLIATGGSLAEAARVLTERGCKDIYVAATHGVLCGNAFERLAEAPMTRIVVTDTIPMRDDADDLLNGKLTVLSIADLLGEAIWRIHNRQSISSLFEVDTA